MQRKVHVMPHLLIWAVVGDNYVVPMGDRPPIMDYRCSQQNPLSFRNLLEFISNWNSMAHNSSIFGKNPDHKMIFNNEIFFLESQRD